MKNNKLWIILFYFFMILILIASIYTIIDIIKHKETIKITKYSTNYYFINEELEDNPEEFNYSFDEGLDDSCFI